MLQKDDCPFQRVEYLERPHNSSCWINTGYVPQGDDLDFYLDFMPVSYSVNFGMWIEAYVNTTETCYRIMRYGSQNNVLAIDYNSLGFLTSMDNVGHYDSIELGVRYKVAMLGTKGIWKVNNIEGKIVKRESGLVNKAELYVFSHNEYVAYGRIYSFRLDKAGVTVLDLVPVRVGDEGFMYDRVSGKLMGNSGTGRFVLGPDI